MFFDRPARPRRGLSDLKVRKRTAGSARRRLRPEREALEERMAPAAGAWSALGAVQTGPALVSSASPSPGTDLSLESQYALSEAIGRDDPSYAMAASGAGYALSNATNQYGAVVDAGGLRVTAGADSWSATVLGVGYGDNLGALGAARETVAGNRVEYDYGAVSQWFVNGPLGLQQGFTLAQRPAGGDGPLTLDLALGGTLIATADAGGRSVTLARADGASALSYGGLIAYDATGRQTPAYMSVHSTADGDVLSIQVDDADAVYPLVIDPYVQQTKLTAPTAQATPKYFGFSVAVSGDGNRVAVGARSENLGASKAGAGVVYVYDRSGTSWTQTAKLTAADGLSGDQLGYSVAISLDGTTIAAGAPGRGAVYVFANPDGAWKQVDKLTVGGAFLGAAVSISGNGDAIVAGVSGVAAYIFTRFGGYSWSLTAGLIPPNGADDGAFGSAVAISADGSSVAVTAPGASVGANVNQGAIYVYGKLGTSWNGPARLVAPNGVAHEQMGGSLSISSDGSVVLAGAPLVSAAYIFTRTGSNWGQPVKLTAPSAGVGALFGDSVSMSADGTIAVVGASRETIGNSLNQGAAYVFSRSGSNWSQSGKLTAAVGTTNDTFGTALAASLDGSTVIVGAPTAYAGANFQGAAFVFADPNSFSVSVNPSSRTVTVGSPTTFTAAAAGAANPAVQWQVSVGGGAWTNISGATNSWYTVTPTLADSGKRYRAVFTSGGQSTTTAASQLTVTKAQTVLKITPSANPRPHGEPLSFTIDAISAVPGGGVPDGGQISIHVGPYNFSGTLHNGRAVFQIPYLEPQGKTGTYLVTANYDGANDPRFDSATATTSQVVVLATTTVVGELPASPVPVGQPVTLRAVLSFAGLGDIPPSGGVVLNDFGQPIAISQIAFEGGRWVATFRLNLTPGDHLFRFLYLGEKMAYPASSPAPQPLRVGTAGAAAAPIVSNAGGGEASNPTTGASPSGNLIKITSATPPVAQSVFAGVPTTFTAAPTNPANASAQWQVSKNGGAWTNIPGATNSWYTVTPTLADSGNRYRAVFAGSGSPETTAAAQLTVAKANTILKVTTSANPRGLGEPLTITVDALPAVPAAGVPEGGLVGVKIGDHILAAPLQNGRAVFQVPYLEPQGKTGTYEITAIYNGDNDPRFASVMATTSQVVVLATTTMVGELPASPVPVGQPVTLRAVLSFAGLGDIPPSGGVVLNDFGQPIAISQIAFEGGRWVATFRLNLTPGDHLFRFLYLGEKMAYTASSPAPQPLRVGAAGDNGASALSLSPLASTAPTPAPTAASPDLAAAIASLAIDEATKQKPDNPFAPKYGAPASSPALALPSALTARRLQQRYTTAYKAL